MFRPVTASIFLLAFVIQMFSGQFIQLDYYLNTGTYAKNCVNKARPKMHCNGKCQAMKKMQQQENKDQQNTERKQDGSNTVLSSRSSFCTVTALPQVKLKASSLEITPSITDRSLSVFHPPQA
jgi:hypothetical protein